MVITDHQTSGRGQRASVWESEKDKNLTFSIGVFDLDLPIQKQFSLHFITALAIVKTINENTLAKATIKWPNDIFVGDKKIAGILIENNLLKQEIYSSVIGIGLNVNQTFFETPHATSLALLTQQEHHKDELLASLLESFEHYLFRKEDSDSLEKLYLKNLYRIEEPHFFEDKNGKFDGVIKGIDSLGKLIVQKEGKLQVYDFKEISYLL